MSKRYCDIENSTATCASVFSSILTNWNYVLHFKPCNWWLLSYPRKQHFSGPPNQLRDCLRYWRYHEAMNDFLSCAFSECTLWDSGICGIQLSWSPYLSLTTYRQKNVSYIIRKHFITVYFHSSFHMPSSISYKDQTERKITVTQSSKTIPHLILHILRTLLPSSD